MYLVSLVLWMGWILEARGNFLYLNLNKQLYIPGSRYSVLNITHDFRNFQASYFDIEIYFNITQTTEKDQTNAIFDFLSADMSEYTEFIDCYNQNINYINALYSQYNPCEETCSFSSTSTYAEQNLKTQLSEEIGNSSHRVSQLTYIIDNTFYPCQEGAYQPELYLSQSIDIYISENSVYQTILHVLVIIGGIQIIIIFIAFMLIMKSKYTELKTTLDRMRGQEGAQELLDSFIH